MVSPRALLPLVTPLQVEDVGLSQGFLLKVGLRLCRAVVYVVH